MDGRTAVQGGRSFRSCEFGRFLSLIVLECQGPVLGITAKDHIFVQLDNHGLMFTVCNNPNVAVGELLLKAFFCRNGIACKIFRLADDVDVTVRSYIDYILIICKIRVISQIVMIARCIVELGTVHGIGTVFTDKTGGNVLDAAIISFASYRNDACGFRTRKCCCFPAAGCVVGVLAVIVVCPHAGRCFIGCLFGGTAGTNVGGIAHRRIDITSQDLDVVHICFTSLEGDVDSVVVANNIDVLGLIGCVIHIAPLDRIVKPVNRDALQAASFCHLRGLSQYLVIGPADLDIRDSKPFVFLADGIAVAYRVSVRNRSFMFVLVIING
ncbi:unknown [Acidaminococcus intestini CAG:325]|nr:unknown [Acidaminococcus intestini CAG:325]